MVLNMINHKQYFIRRMKVYWNDEIGDCGCGGQMAGVE